MGDKIINHEYTNEIVCPYCDYEFDDSFEYDSDCEDIGLVYCENCTKEFYANRNVQISYSTKRAEYGTCKKCGKEDVVIESGSYYFGEYKDLCIRCRNKERNRLEIEYLKNFKVFK